MKRDTLKHIERSSASRFACVPAMLILTAALAYPALAQDSDGDTLPDFDEINIHLTDPNNADTDGDGLRDDWEIYGIPYTDIGGQPRRYKLCVPAWSAPGSCARRKTLYLEADSMSGMDRFDLSYTLTSWFRNVPVGNPDGSTGIDIIVTRNDIGLPRNVWTFNPGAGIFWPPEFTTFKTNYFGAPSERADPSWSIPNGIRDAKLKAFHYVVFADRLGSTNVGGVAELFGNDLIVTLGGWWFGGWPPTPAELLWSQRVAQGVLMHELGHNLGLHHGGFGDPTNFKPNYHSVQNYSWTTPRNPFFPRNPNAMQLAYGASWTLDYSNNAMPNIDENTLSELVTTMCGGCVGTHSGHAVPIGPASGMGWGSLVNASTPGIDFNNDGDSLDPLVAADINSPYAGACSPLSICDAGPGCTRIDACPLQGSDDWSNVVLMGSGGQYANGLHGSVIPPGLELSFEDSRMLGLVGGCEFDDPFDFYSGGIVDLHERGGWKGWDNDPAFSAPVTSTQARSSDKSVDVSGATDLVHELCSRHSTSGSLGMSVSAWQYIPSDFVSGGGGALDGSYFVLLNTYQDGGPHLEANFSVQMQFDSNDGLLKVFHGDGLNTINVPYETDRWVKLQVIVDLETDWTQIYYDDALITEYTWTGGVLGGGGGALDVGAVDLYANGSTSIYYDDLSFEDGCGSLNGDEDLDGLLTRDEFLFGTSPCKEDSDDDGLLDFDEINVFFTNPIDNDSDDDGLTDGEEMSLFGTDPLNPDSNFNGIPDGEEDSDFDGITDAEELHVFGTDPLLPDSDGDGLIDLEELNLGTDPTNPDTDEDTVLDGFDNCPLVQNTGQSDRDFDGVGDACDFDHDCPSDLDGDGSVGLSDLAILLSNFGTSTGASGSQGDTDNDGDVDLSDLARMLSDFGTPCI